MEKEKYRICWNITSNCNENCRYCHRFMIKERKFRDNKRILKKLIEDGITNITWSGGEALLYKDVVKLMKISKNAGIKNKLITNGIVFSQLEDKEKEEICENLDTMVLSIDSIDEKTNIELGRGKNHFVVVKDVLEYMKDKKVKMDINTVVSKKSVDKITELADFLNNYKINIWKFFRFMPFRGKAKKNREQFEIENMEVEEVVKEIEKLKLENINTLYYKTEGLVEEDIVLNAQGEMYQSIRNSEGEFKDYYKGNAMYDNVVEAIKESRQPKTKNVFRDSLKVNQENKENNNKCESYPECCNETYKKEDGKEPDIDE